MRWKAIAVVIIAVLIGGYFYLSREDGYSTMDDEEISFQVENPDDVTKIFITRKNSDPITLTKKGDRWYVNDKHKAWTKKVNFLIYETMAKQKVKGPATKSARDRVIRNMAVTGIKVQVFKNNNDKPSDEFYVGHSTSTMNGNYFWKEGANTPYLVYVPGADRILDPAYIFQEKEWISRTIFEVAQEDLNRVSITYPENEKLSFEILNKEGEYEIKTHPDNPTDVNVTAVRSYLNHFEKLNYEGFSDLLNDTLVDSLLQTKPALIVETQDRTGEVVTMEVFKLPSYNKMHGLYDSDGNLLQYDPNRYLAKASNFSRPLIIQDYTFRKVFVTYDQFRLANAN